MSTVALVSVEEYLRHTEKPNCEYHDGVILPKAMPTLAHGRMQLLLLMLLNKLGLEALPEITVRISPTAYLVPDVIADENLHGSYPVEPVLLCIEILSPEDRVGAMLAKCEQYHAWGVPNCWVIDPVKLVAWEYLAGGEPTRLTESGSLHAGKVSISVAELFANSKS
jgi:Uma2 family endonuclease